MRMESATFLLLGWLLFPIICAIIASYKGRSSINWFFLSIFWGFIGLFFLILSPRITDENDSDVLSRVLWAIECFALGVILIGVVCSLYLI